VPRKTAERASGSIASPPWLVALVAPAAGVGVFLVRRRIALTPRDQFARAERFCHIVIAADLQPENAIDLLVARRQKQDRRIRGLPDLAADFETVHLRHADVEHDEFVNLVVELAQRVLAVLCGGNHHAGFFKREAHDVTDMRVIINDENGMSHVC